MQWLDLKIVFRDRGGVFSWCDEGLSESAISRVDSQWHKARHLAVGVLGKFNLISTLLSLLRFFQRYLPKTFSHKSSIIRLYRQALFNGHVFFK